MSIFGPLKFKKREIELDKKIENLEAYVHILELALMQMATHFLRKCPQMSKLGITPGALAARYKGYAQSGVEAPLLE